MAALHILQSCFGWETVLAIGTLFVGYCIIKWLNNPFRKIPGPKGSFLLGNSKDLSKPNDGHKVLVEWGRTYGDIYKTWNIIGGYMVHLQNPDDIKRVLVTDNIKYNRPNFIEKLLDFKIKGRTLFNVNGKEHAMQRKMLNPSFSYGSVQNYIPIFNEVVNTLIEVWNGKLNDGGGLCEDEIQEKFTNLTLDVIGEAGFGYKFNSLIGGHGKESKATDTILRGQFNFGRRALESYFPVLKLFQTAETKKVDEAKEILDSIVLKVIKERTANKETNVHEENRKDLLQILLNMRRDGITDFKDEDILAQVRLFMIAGHETTSMTMTWTILLLAKHPEYQERAREEIRRVLGDRDEITLQDSKEMTFLDNCIKESMRLYPAASFFNRSTTTEMKLGKYTIPKGTYITVDIANVHRNEKFWKDADCFKPDRFNSEADQTNLLYNFIPFSRGPRMCIGYRFAEVEVKVVLAKLLRAFSFQFNASQRTEFQGEIALTLRPSPSPIVAISKAQ